MDARPAAAGGPGGGGPCGPNGPALPATEQRRAEKAAEAAQEAREQRVSVASRISAEPLRVEHVDAGTGALRNVESRRAGPCRGRPRRGGKEQDAPPARGPSFRVDKPAFPRLERVLGGGLRSRILEAQRVEAATATRALNRMAELGMPRARRGA